MLVIDGRRLTIEDVVSVARMGTEVGLSPAAVEAMNESGDLVRGLVDKGEVVYGVTTGFGKLANVTISGEQAAELQVNLIRSHAVGVGEPLAEEVVRAVMLLRANTLAKGFSGIRPVVVQTLLDMLNGGIYPVIPAQGSVGASGDLIPLAHMTLPLIGEGEATRSGKQMPAREALEGTGIKPVVLEAKEGLALINGTTVMTAIAALAVHDAGILLDTADTAAALTMEALRGIDSAFDENVTLVRAHVGQARSAANLRLLLEGSGLVSSAGELRIQDPYSLRCTPQVHGASRDAVAYVRGVVEVEINSATDNPLIFPGLGRVISAGNFHGQPVALAMDFLGIALSELANIANCRVSQLMVAEVDRLPPFLVERGGLNTGLMLTQYTAAALVSENKVLASPASVDSIPTSAFQEDHVSMGTIAARKALNILANVVNVTAIELFCAAQAIDFHQPCRLGRGTAAAYRTIRENVAGVTEDRIMYPDIHRLARMVKEGVFATFVPGQIPADVPA
jgi:histidine ammonia-lyase